MKKQKLFFYPLLFILFILLGLSLFIYFNKENITYTKKINTKQIINSIIKDNNLLNNNIDYKFLNWINNKYPNSLIKLNKIINNNNYSLSTWHDITNNSINVLLDLYNNQNLKNTKIINNNANEANINFVGDISLADNFEIMPYYDSRNKNIYGILSEDVVKIMNNADIMIANNEFTFSTRGTPLPNKLYTFRANPSRVNIYKEMGIDLVTLANNHVYDYGLDALNDTFETLNNANIPYVGAGKNIKEASSPYYFILNGYKIAFINATRAEKNIMTKEATDTESGVFRCYDSTLLISTIEETKKTSDFVFALIHWGKEDSTDLEEVQTTTSKEYIDAGADAIIGTHAHILQGIEFYKNKPIIYNIGDFIFNSEIKDTAIINFKLNNKGELTYYLIPCLQSNQYTTLLKNSEQERVINKIQNLSSNTIFNNYGQFYENN